MFIDRVRVKLKAGDGGNGCCSFRREKFVPRGGPDGGDGGNGGNVIFKVDQGETTLVSLHSRPYYEAKKGVHGEGSNKTGQRGSDIILRVPPGTVVEDAETGERICDLTDADQEVIIVRGGRGGRGNARFTTSTRQAPRYCEPGEKGEMRTLNVELKMIAQVGLVGFPNAGKSTLIRSLTRAHARIGAYPFTTLSPVIGTLPLSETETIIIADIPGLIEGAHQGAGLGTDFLRHVERTRILVFVLDLSGGSGPEPGEALRILRNELGQYRKDLLDRRWIVALNKCDLLEDREREEWSSNLESFLQEIGEPSSIPVCMISGLTGEGTPDLVDLIRVEYQQIRQLDVE